MTDADGVESGVVVIGYSGHAFVVCEILKLGGRALLGYCDTVEKAENPFALPFLGSESGELAGSLLRGNFFFVAIGDNRLRRKIHAGMTLGSGELSAVHPAATLSGLATLGGGSMLAAGAVVSPLAVIGSGAIINSAAVVEHGCRLGDFVHVAPGAVLCGDVSLGDGAFVGANAVVRPGIEIGSGAVVGAGAVVLGDVPPGATVVGKPCPGAPTLRPVEKVFGKGVSAG